MSNVLLKVDIADCCLGLDLKYSWCAKESLINYSPSVGIPAITTSVTEDIKQVMSVSLPELHDAELEYMFLPLVASTALLEFDIVIVHAVAMLWRDKAWLFVAPSGTGKSTQYFRWKELLGDEVNIINGDKPALKLCSDGQVYVYNTPWQGKENFGNDLSAPLGGVIFLSQEKENTISVLSAHDALIPFFCALLFRPDADTFHAAARIVDAAFSHVPALKLGNLGDLASAELTRDFLIKEGYV